MTHQENTPARVQLGDHAALGRGEFVCRAGKGRVGRERALSPETAGISGRWRTAPPTARTG